MSKAERTREYIIEKAAPIFNRKGYAGTSLTDLIEATGLTKGSIYGNFENKDEIAIAVYEYSVKAIGKKLDDLINAKQTASDKLTAFTEYHRINWKKTFERGGCPILNAAVEADDNLPFLKNNVQGSIKKLVLKVSRIIEEGKKNGEFKKNINATDYAYTTIIILEGGIMLSKIENNPKHLFAGLDRIIKIINEEIKK
ncbi:MAG: TetR/AcrR family transcriptional regulator [Bacteroidota bacterium]|nr:TetR/AcrR family transcriptional regulator [Bacteroidota bacterium]